VELSVEVLRKGKKVIESIKESVISLKRGQSFISTAIMPDFSFHDGSGDEKPPVVEVEEVTQDAPMLPKKKQDVFLCDLVLKHNLGDDIGSTVIQSTYYSSRPTAKITDYIVILDAQATVNEARPNLVQSTSFVSMTYSNGLFYHSYTSSIQTYTTTTQYTSSGYSESQETYLPEYVPSSLEPVYVRNQDNYSHSGNYTPNQIQFREVLRRPEFERREEMMPDRNYRLPERKDEFELPVIQKRIAQPDLIIPEDIMVYEDNSFVPLPFEQTEHRLNLLVTESPTVQEPVQTEYKVSYRQAYQIVPEIFVPDYTQVETPTNTNTFVRPLERISDKTIDHVVEQPIVQENPETVNKTYSRTEENIDSHVNTACEIKAV
jgi:hypothetical protein